MKTAGLLATRRAEVFCRFKLMRKPSFTQIARKLEKGHMVEFRWPMQELDDFLTRYGVSQVPRRRNGAGYPRIAAEPHAHEKAQGCKPLL